MADGKVKTILGKRITLLGLATVIAALVTVNFSGSALAYTADDPAVKYHCFVDQNGDKAVTAADEKADANGNMALEPCRIDTGDNAWMLTSSALVLMMTPAGLAIFYGGLARQKNAVNTLHMVFITTGLIAIQYVLWGYSLAFDPDAGGFGFIGTLDWIGLNHVTHDAPSLAYGGIDGGSIDNYPIYPGA